MKIERFMEQRDEFYTFNYLNIPMYADNSTMISWVYKTNRIDHWFSSDGKITEM